MPRLPMALAQCALLAGFVAASVWSLRMAFADYWFRRENTFGTEEAIRYLPGQAAYQVRLAQLEPDDDQLAIDALQRAVALNPADAPTWVELGLRYESNGNRKMAEQCLLRAAQEDKQYLPRWTLANYYFRQNENTKFWFWAKESATMISGDPLPLFQLCSRLVEDGNLIDRLDIKRPDVRANYLYYLLTRSRADLTPASARSVLKQDREADVPVLLSVCERLLEAARGDEALLIWNGLAEAHRIAFSSLAPANGKVLTNGDFAVRPTSQGFDWRLPVIEGVSASSEENPTGLRVTFSGRQPERCEPVFQFVPIQAKTAYRLRFQYRSSFIRPGAGLRWRVTDTKTLLSEGESLYSENETEREISFVTPADTRLVRLSLSYDRAPGTTRTEGFIVVRNVELIASRP